MSIASHLREIGRDHRGARSLSTPVIALQARLLAAALAALNRPIGNTTPC